MARAAASRALVLILVIASAFAVSMPASAQSGDEAALSRAKEQVAALTRQIEAAQSQRADASSGLAVAEQQVREVEDAVNRAAAALDRQRSAVDEARRTLDELRQQADEITSSFQARAANVYKNGSGVPFALVLASGDVQDAVERSEFLEVINEGDRATLEDVTTSQVAVRAQRRRLEAETARLTRMKQEQDELLVQVSALRDTRAMQLAEAQANLADLRERKDEVEAEQERIKQLIAQNRLTPAMATAPSTAGYVWPLCGAVTSEYGRRWGRMHAGIDIDGSTGDPIGAAKDGVVIFAGWQSGYGNMTLIDHGDGVVTGYGHQSRIIVTRGQHVVRGERIGAVGSTGHSTGSHLHFETRVNGDAVNPRRFLPDHC